MKLDVNSKELIRFTTKLEQTRKSAFPVTVRQTLNTLAFETKKRIPAEAKAEFVIRSPSFFRSFSGVEMAQGFDVNTMKSKAGMQDRRGSNEQAIQNMVPQQLGGKIGGRTLIPIRSARVNNSDSKMVKKENRVRAINQVLDTRKSKGKDQKQRFVKTAIMVTKLYGKGTMSHTTGGKTTLYRVQKSRGTGKIKTTEGLIGYTPIYSVKKGRSVNVEARPFVKKAALKSASQTNAIFVKHANRNMMRK